MKKLLLIMSAIVMLSACGKDEPEPTPLPTMTVEEQRESINETFAVDGSSVKIDGDNVIHTIPEETQITEFTYHFNETQLEYVNVKFTVESSEIFNESMSTLEGMGYTVLEKTDTTLTLRAPENATEAWRIVADNKETLADMLTNQE